MHLTFDDAAIAAEVVTLLRQNPCWAAADLTQARQDPRDDAISPVRQDVAAASEDQHAQGLAMVA